MKNLKTTIFIGSGVECCNLPNKAKEKVAKDLSFPNPAYVSAMKRGAFISADTPPKIELFDADEDTNTYWIPRGYAYWLFKFMREELKHPFKIEDCTLVLKPLNLSFIGKLRPYQEKAKRQMLKYPVGVLEASTGSGKTTIALAIIVERKQRTLIIVHSKELLYQWQGAIKQFLGIDCGLIGAGKFQIKPITVGIINTVNKRLDDLTENFGHVICDECHKITASSWSETLQDFPAKYYLGLTATPFRRDGLGHAIFASIGPKIHKVDKKMLLDTGAVLRPNVFRIPTNFRYVFSNDYSTMISSLTKDENRNNLIVDEIAMDLKKYQENIIVVSDRKHHCESMNKILQEKYKIKGRVLTGAGKKKDREEIVKEVKTGQCKVLFATISLIGEGFDSPNLTALFLTTPVKFSGRLIQCVGRVLRPSKNKQPRVYDFRDNQIELLKYTGYSRDRVYIKEFAA